MAGLYIRFGYTLTFLVCFVILFFIDVPSEAVQLVGEKLGERRVTVGEDLPFSGPEIDVPLATHTEGTNGEETTLSCSVKHCLPHPSFAWYKGDQMIHPGT